METHIRTGLTAVAIGAAFVAGLATGGDLTPAGSGDDEPRRVVSTGRQELSLAKAALRPATSCEQLRRWYVDRALDRVTAWGWNGPFYYADGTFGERDLSGAVAPSAADSTYAGADSGVTASATGTNVQEAGVDEPDGVKTDGSLLVTVQGGRLSTYDVTGSAPELLATIVLPDLLDAEILLSGTTVVAVGTDTTAGSRRAEPPGFVPTTVPGTRVTVVDVTDPATPAITDSRVYDSTLVTARQHGDVIRLVLSAGLPELPFVMPTPGARGLQRALIKNRDVVRDSAIEDWLPQVTTYDGDLVVTEPAVDCAQVAIPADESGLGTVTVVSFHAEDPDGSQTTGVATGTQTAYLSTDRLYLASGPAFGWWPTVQPTLDNDAFDGPVYVVPASPGGLDTGVTEPNVTGTDDTEPEPNSTTLYAFDLADLATSFVASGTVDGIVEDRWSMDEVGGVLRVAVGGTGDRLQANAVVTLADRAGTLTEIGRVGHLGPGEQIKAVRWLEDRAIVVTFRQTDPLYVVDLADPDRPRLLGKLKIPGYSEYLHPLGDDLLLGLGQDATRSGRVRGAQAALFDVSDPGSPRRLDALFLGGQTQANAAWDPRQFTWLPDRSTALTVVTSWRSGTVRVVHLPVEGGSTAPTLTEWSDRLGPRVDGGQVRLVPLPSGQVILWTGSAVSFLDLEPPAR